MSASNARPKSVHPLRVLFGCKRLHPRQGMNLLQEGPELFISDLCVEPEDVAPCDVLAVLDRAQARWHCAAPDWPARYLPQTSALPA